MGISNTIQQLSVFLENREGRLDTVLKILAENDVNIVFELHGSVHRNYCENCRKFYNLDDMLNLDGIVPHCEECGSIVKPDVVLYEEALDDEVVNKAISAISKADLLIIGGTSLMVYPASYSNP